jgi:hypothetical protein
VQKPISLTSIALLVLVTNLVGCGTRVGSYETEKYNQNPLTVVIPSGLSEERVESVMKHTLSVRGWRVDRSSPQRTDGILNHRSFKGKVSLVVDDGTIRILNRSRYISKANGGTEPGVPRGWLENLRKDLVRRLNTASRQL